MKVQLVCVLAILFFSMSMARKIEFHFESLNDGSFEAETCQVGDQIEIHLAEDPNSGYIWMIPEEKEGYNAIWNLEDSKFEQLSKSIKDGSGGIRTFLLNCEYAGTEHLTFVYGKPELYNRAIAEFKKEGMFDALTMGGKALQLRITSLR
ncbi:unnamed protein product [Moneuplotes crassus]|uniref:Proteinase inhibitor I42 chagasin domain-containing protein n=1 Tax=Euplotes crassus TaxID=5936 RepID=A0AAD1Y281_EUPCR|nr:unnamed protein product [Moneuplotes crassus]